MRVSLNMYKSMVIFGNKSNFRIQQTFKSVNFIKKD